MQLLWRHDILLFLESGNEVTYMDPSELLHEKMFEDPDVNIEAVYYSKMKGELTMDLNCLQNKLYGKMSNCTGVSRLSICDLA